MAATLSISACTGIPNKESGQAKVEVNKEFDTYQPLIVHVSQISDLNSGQNLYTFEPSLLSKNAVIIPAGNYHIIYSCFQQKNTRFLNRLSGRKPIQYSEKIKVGSGEYLRLNYLYVTNDKHGDHCRPYFSTNI